MDESINQQYLYDFLLKDCISLTQQIEELLRESTITNQKKPKILSINFEREQISEEKMEKNQTTLYLKTEPSPKMEEEENDNMEEIKKKKEHLLKEKKNLEDQFLDTNIDIQRKGKQLGDFQDEIKKTQEEIENLDKQIKEKTDFVQFLEDQISSLKGSYKK